MSENEIIALMNNPRVTLDLVRCSRLIYAHKFCVLVDKFIEHLDEKFARVFGFALLIIATATRLNLPINRHEAISKAHSIAELIAIILFSLWLLRLVVKQNFLKFLEDWLSDYFRKVVFAVRAKRELRDSQGIIVFDRIPQIHQSSIINSIATLAFNRWPENGTLETRVQFFTSLVNQNKHAFVVAVSYSESSDSMRTIGYASVVGLDVKNYQKHLFGEVNLFEQTQGFFLTDSEIRERILEYKSPIPIDLRNRGLAIYVLGMNITPSIQGTATSAQLLKSLDTLVASYIEESMNPRPFLYTTTGIKEVMDYLTNKKFTHKGRRSKLGNKFYESSLEPETPGVSPSAP